jgi:NADP-dependent 3-hydroxy acid dehydrogenase YdfG
MSPRYLQPPPEPDLPSSLTRDSDHPLFGGRVAVVTGAAQGIGAGIARALGYHGATLVLVDTDGLALAATAAGIATFAMPPANSAARTSW